MLRQFWPPTVFDPLSFFTPFFGQKNRPVFVGFDRFLYVKFQNLTKTRNATGLGGFVAFSANISRVNYNCFFENNSKNKHNKNKGPKIALKKRMTLILHMYSTFTYIIFCTCLY